MNAEIENLLNLSGQVALVTGGARALGHDAASILAATDTYLAITSRDLSRAENTAGELSEQYDVDVRGLPLKQTDRAQVQPMVAKTQVDILANNAGGGSGEKAGLFERDPQDMATLIEMKLTGVLKCCREIGRFMAERSRGKIINIASIARRPRSRLSHA